MTEAPTKSIFPDEPQTPETNLWYCFMLATRGYRFSDIHTHTLNRKQKAYGKCKQGDDLTVEFEAPLTIDRAGMFNLFKNDIVRLKSIIHGNDSRYERKHIRRYDHWRKAVEKEYITVIERMDIHGLLN